MRMEFSELEVQEWLQPVVEEAAALEVRAE
jgi:hypothetical protein